MQVWGVRVTDTAWHLQLTSQLNSFSVSWTIKLAFSLGAYIVTIHQECGESFVKFCKVCSFVLLVIDSSKCGALLWIFGRYNSTRALFEFT